LAHTTYRDPAITTATAPNAGIYDIPVTPSSPLPVTSVGTSATGGPQPSATITPATWIYAGVTGGIVDTTPVAMKAAGAAGVKNYLAGIQFANSAAVASEIVVLDGAAVIWRGYAAASGVGGNADIKFVPPLAGTAATAMNVAMITTATATRVSAQGYTGA
jgi:hypothetical protein